MGQQPSQGGYRPREKEPRQPLGDDEWAAVAVSRGKKPSMAQTTAYTSSGGASNAFSALGKKDVKKEAPKPPKEEKPLKPAKPDKVKAEEKPKRRKGKATLDEFKDEWPKVLQEYYGALDVEDAVNRLREFGLADAHHEEAVQ